MLDTYKAIVEAWRRATSKSAGDSDFTFSCPQALWEVGRQALARGDYALLASTFEAQGVADLLLIRAHGQMLPLTVLDSLGALVKAAHWYRAAGDSERAALVGQRAWLEVKLLLDREAAGTFELPEANLHWYVVEMAGDAAVCFDVATAAGLFDEAEKGFRDMDDIEQAANAAETYPGMEYIHELGHRALHPCTPPAAFDYDGVKRIEHKRKHWLRSDTENTHRPAK